MTKNRESAARSRARKQERVSPYTSSPFLNACESKENNRNKKSSAILLCIKNGIWVCILLIFQAYTNELELEIIHLRKENARLKRQEEQVQTFRSLVPS